MYRSVYFTLTSSSSLTLDIAQASLALLSLNQDLDFVELFDARHSTSKLGSALT
ncbi:MAG: hypothetical protein IJK51_08030 [Bacteroidaceae bacterium]|nr:hypothetical protein [Bacteroidaceae bacterium]